MKDEIDRLQKQLQESSRHLKSLKRVTDSPAQHNDQSTSITHYDSKYFAWQRSLNVFGGQFKQRYWRDYVREGDVCAEFGSSSGAVIANMKKCSQRFGVELNDIAREEAAKNYPDIKFVKYSEDLPDDSIDIVVTTSVIEHVENPVQELRRLLYKLKEGGTIVATIKHESNPHKWVPHDKDNHLYTWNEMLLGNTLTAAGFQVSRVDAHWETWLENPVQKFAELGEEEFFRQAQRKGKEKNVAIVVGVGKKERTHSQ